MPTSSGALVDAEQILLTKPLKDTAQHYGGRMLFLPDGTLLLSTGDGFDYREAAQAIHSELGKVLRINDDGSIPADNPFVAEGANRVWTYGHRNIQGIPGHLTRSCCTARATASVRLEAPSLERMVLTW